MKVVAQPLGCGRNGTLLADCDTDGAIRVEQDPAVFLQPGPQPPSSVRPRRDRLRSSEALSMLFEALDAEQFRADWLFGVRRKSGGRSLQSAKERNAHTCLSRPQTRQGRGDEWVISPFISPLGGKCTDATS